MAWSLSESLGRLETESLSARLDLRYPTHGLVGVRTRMHGGSWEEARGEGFLRVFAAGESREPHAVIESYVRGSDLVASYAPSSVGEVHSQCYWRSLGRTMGTAVGLEVVVSVQTNLLESDPVSIVSSSVSAEAVWGLAAPDRVAWQDLGDVTAADCAAGGLLLFRLSGGGVSYAEMIHPSDSSACRIVAASGHVRSTFRLFEERLEKGVIRRGRLRGFFLPRGDDRATALELFRQFAAAPPPLTA